MFFDIFLQSISSTQSQSTIRFFLE